MSTGAARIVVGVDATPGSDAACAYAAMEARQRFLELTLVHAWQPYPFMPPALWAPLPPPVLRDDLRRAAEQTMDRALQIIRREDPDLVVEPQLVEGNATPVLLSAAHDARLLVVGRNDDRHHARAWLGSVTGNVAQRAACPVTVVPASAPADGEVVVGVDGSEASTEAIAFAFEEASRRCVALRAVHATHPSHVGAPTEAEELAELHEALRMELSESLAGWSEKFPDVQVSSLVSIAHPLTALLSAAQTAGLLVVGSHGRGAVMSHVLGSVSAALLRSAPCAIAVVRAAAT